MTHSDDGLDCARGIFSNLPLGLALWLAIIGLILWLIGCGGGN